MIISCLFCNNKFVKNREINISRENAITYAIDKASDSVVGINVTQIKQQSFDPFFDPFLEVFGGILGAQSGKKKRCRKLRRKMNYNKG